MDSLRHGAFAEAPFLGAGEAAEEAADRYRSLVQLVVSAAKDGSSDEEQTTATLGAYARWVRISLRMLAENGTVPPINGGTPARPILGLPKNMPIWQPSPVPPGWNEEIDTETAG